MFLFVIVSRLFETGTVLLGNIMKFTYMTEMLSVISVFMWSHVWPSWAVVLCYQCISEYASGSIRELTAAFSVLIALLTLSLSAPQAFGHSEATQLQSFFDTIVSLKYSSPDVLSIDKFTIQISIIDCNMQN